MNVASRPCEWMDATGEERFRPMGQSVVKYALRLAAVAALFGSVPAYAQSDSDAGSEVGPVNIVAGVRLDVGYDTNLFGASSDSDNAQGSGTVVVSPSIRASSIDPGMVRFEGGLGFSWTQQLGDEDARRQSRESIDSDIELQINPNGTVSVTPSNTLVRSSRASFSTNGDPFKSLTNTFELSLGYHPGGALRVSRLGLTGSLSGFVRSWRYDGAGLDDANKNGFGGRLEVKYNFLPRTAWFANAMVMSIANENSVTGRDVDDSVTPPLVTGGRANPNSFEFRGTTGVTGLLTPRLGMLVALGFGQASYQDVDIDNLQGGQAVTETVQTDAVTALVAEVGLTAYLSEDSEMGLTYMRNLQDGAVEDGFTYHRVSLSSLVRFDPIVAGADVFVQRNAFTNTDTSNIQGCSDDIRQETVIGANADVGYRPLRFLTVGARYGVESRNGNCDGPSVVQGGNVPVGVSSADYTKHSIFGFLALSN